MQGTPPRGSLESDSAQIWGRRTLTLHLSAGIDLQKGYYLRPYTCVRTLARAPRMQMLRLARMRARPKLVAGRRRAFGRRFRNTVQNDQVENTLPCCLAIISFCGQPGILTCPPTKICQNTVF